MNYEPNYVSGQILVSFKGKASPEFAKTFGTQLGYELFPKKYLTGDLYIYETKNGEEQVAIDIFNSFNEFVDFSSLRDIKLEIREKSLENAINSLLSMQGNVEIDDLSYNKKIKKIITDLQ